MTDLETNREFYDHDMDCSRTNFEEPNIYGLKRCKDCSGIFDKDGKGVAVTDRRFDEQYQPPEDAQDEEE